jgi:hypothetical protein
MAITHTVVQNKWADPPDEAVPIQVKMRISNNFLITIENGGKIMNKD